VIVSDPDDNVQHIMAHRKSGHPCTSAEPGTVRSRVDELVEVALDDIESGNLRVRGALRIIAVVAWHEGRDCCS
jgi:hypothetical protein